MGRLANLYKDSHPLEDRIRESSEVREKYPDKCPIILQPHPKSDVPHIDKQKYLLPSELLVSQFVHVIRKRLQLSPETAIFLFVNDVLPPTAALLGQIYEDEVDDDGFLYIYYSGEKSLGCVGKYPTFPLFDKGS